MEWCGRDVTLMGALGFWAGRGLHKTLMCWQSSLDLAKWKWTSQSKEKGGTRHGLAEEARLAVFCWATALASCSCLDIVVIFPLSCSSSTESLTTNTAI